MDWLENHITVRVKYKSVDETFAGQVEEVWMSINRFFSEFIPAFEISKKLVLAVDLQRLVSDCENIVAFTEQGPQLLVSKDHITDNEVLILHLLACYIGRRVGAMKSDAASRNKLQAKLGKPSKITSTRLGELVKRELVTRTDDGEYRISTLGVVHTQKNVLSKIKERMGL